MTTDAIYKRVDDVAQCIAEDCVFGKQSLLVLADRVVLFKDEDRAFFYESLEQYMDVICTAEDMDVVEGCCVYDVRDMTRDEFWSVLVELESLKD